MNTFEQSDFLPAIGEDLVTANNAAADIAIGEGFLAGRRSFLKAGIVSAAALGFWMPSLAEAARPSSGRELKMTNVHTGEKFRGAYWVNGKYLPDAFGEIKSVMRDHRTGEKFPIDPRLMDILYVLHNRMRSDNPFKIFSGYRSSATNAKLRRMSGGVARNSLHMTGQAIDISLPGASLGSLRKSAISLKSGGVGFYPSSDFVHIDTGRARHW